MSGPRVVPLTANGGTAEVRRDLATTTAGAKWRFVLLSAVLVLSIIAVYLPVRNYSFLVGIDDNGYVYENPRVVGPLNWPTIKWAFTHSFLQNYDPLTFLGHNINVRLFGLNAGRHHEVNVFLHAVDALLLFWLLKQATGFMGRSFMVAALFAVHPINVENVAWISELKTMLSTAFFFAALAAYRWYAQKPKLRRMLWVGFLYGLGPLAKPQVITLPFVLLLWDYWPLRRMCARDPQIGAGVNADERFAPTRISRLIIEKIPLFFIAAVDVVLTLHAENKPDLERYTFLIRLGTAIRSYIVYMGKAVWPVNLAFNYPHPGYSLHWVEVWASLMLLVVITAAILIKRQHRYLLVGWFWFLGTMLPMINLVQIDVAAVADRYAYTSFVGLFVIVCWGVADLVQQRHLPTSVLPAFSAATLVILSFLTHYQVRYWSDAVAVLNRTIQVAPQNWGARCGLGNLLVQQGRIEEGLTQFYKALENNPEDSEILEDIAVTEHQRGNLRQAIEYYQRALTVSKKRELDDPAEQAKAYRNMAIAYRDMGDIPHSVEAYSKYKKLRGLK